MNRLEMKYEVVLILASIIFGIAIHNIFTNLAYFGEYQTIRDVQDRYSDCKQAAIENMDCVMVPMMVSKDYMQEIALSER